ncbi:MAG: 2-amino-4-hydroxy-6-hydroxymethyldihydropteridine pyrophosphokinae [Schumannella sp.]|jgi:2-amino-4-hydroxy-6-hydroxymethyldihydropteridine diphosphokinase|nr:2-amino-4-hydroxy-6-hydroxymethyldihydropteridine pyrophosphokinae [Schumannella sp.]
MTDRTQHSAVIALGSNLGDREETIRGAIRDIAAIPGVEVTAASGLVETPALKPEGVDTDAPAYLNAVATVVTTLDAHYLLRALNGIEAARGRVRAARWGDRTLDLDIVEYGRLMIASEDLTVPHPRAGERAFVLAPWLQIEPDATLPGLGRIDALLAATGETPLPYPAEPLL